MGRLSEVLRKDGNDSSNRSAVAHTPTQTQTQLIQEVQEAQAEQVEQAVQVEQEAQVEQVEQAVLVEQVE